MLFAGDVTGELAMMTAHGVNNAADELIDALLEMSGLLAAKAVVREENGAVAHFESLGIDQPPSVHELDERLNMTISRVNTAVATYRSSR
jgi:hypothetical protein